MSPSAAVSFCLAVLCSSWRSSKGYDPFEGILPGAPCFKRRPITGCNGTLMTKFKPTSSIAPNQPDTLVFLFTQKNKDNPEFLHECGGTLPSNTNFDSSHQTEIFVHGYSDGTCRTAWMREMRDQLFLRGDYNVILIDWTWGNTFDVMVAQNNTIPVGQQIGFVIRNLIADGGASAQDIHIIGHSYGAHVAGIAGKTVKILGRITALDPASPQFRTNPPEERMSATDANLVDVIHASGADCLLGGFGTDRSWGHADFYPNGGTIPQMSCHPHAIISLLKLDVLTGLISLLPIVCSHLQSIEYYKVSINTGDCGFLGFECSSYESFQNGECERNCGEDGSSCAVMGMDFGKNFRKSINGSRNFYLNTKLECPYYDCS